MFSYASLDPVLVAMPIVFLLASAVCNSPFKHTFENSQLNNKASLL